MSKKSVVLSYSGLKNIITNCQWKEDEFRFINGQQEMKMPRFFAQFFFSKSFSHPSMRPNNRLS